MTEEIEGVRLYLPDIIAFFLPQSGLIIFLMLFMNFEPTTISELNLMIYSFWFILAIPGLISGFLTRNTTDGFESTFLSGVILFPILGTIGLLMIQRLIFTNFLLILISGVVIGVYLGCFGYIGGWIGKKALTYSRPSEKKTPFELLKGIFPITRKDPEEE